MATRKKGTEDCDSSISTSSGSSETRARRQRRKKQKSPEEQVLYASCMSRAQVENLLEIDYCKLKPFPKFVDIKDLPFEDLLQQLLGFECDGGNKSEEVVKTMLENDKEIEHTGIKEMLREKLFQVNLKECGVTDLEAVKNYPGKAGNKAYLLLRHLVDIFDEVFTCPSPANEKKSGAHDVLKRTIDWIAYASGYTTKCLTRASGECRQRFQRIHYPREASTLPVCVTVKGKPDFVFGPRGGSQHCIPVEVYAPYHLEVTESNEGISSKHDILTTTECDSEGGTAKRSHRNLKECLPDVTEVCPTLTESQKRYYETKLCAQHVTHLFGIAVEALNLCDVPPKYDEQYILIGMFLMNEYCFFSKMTVGRDFILYCPQPSSRSLYEEYVPKVEFFPTALDLTRFNHRLAIICFLCHHAITFFPDSL